ncbi:hypothetical protein WMY93_013926 [Mugilogobius chulae]|uniref:Uncharacterized protein n=1 Tax=Mugilogobius chulae TaxID=88201 RepID=A0AAW0P0X9_9GOBI
MLQARALRSQIASVKKQQAGNVMAKKKELKAARTLGSELHQTMETSNEVELCFPAFNNSCRRTSRPELETTFIYIVLSTITVLTVVLNLLVIISIAHFRQK